MQTADANQTARRVDDLIAGLKESDVSRRAQTARALGELRDPQAVEALAEALRNSQYGTKPGIGLFWSEAAVALGRIGGERAVQALIALLQRPHTSLLRACAAEGLAEARDERAVEALMAAFESPEAFDYDGGPLLGASARALGRIGGQRAWEYLTAMVQHETAEYRAAAAQGLGASADPRAIELLIRALQSPGDDLRSGGVRAAAADALGELGDQRAILPLLDATGDGWWEYAGEDHFYPVRHAAERALKKLGSTVVDVLIAELQSADAERRRLAAWFLGDLGDSRAVEPLTAALNDSDQRVRLGAKASLEHLSRSG